MEGLITFTEKDTNNLNNSSRIKSVYLEDRATNSISNHRTDENSKVLSASYHPASRGQGHPATISS